MPGRYAMSEDQLFEAIRALVRTLGLRMYHTRDSRRSYSGFPDLVIVGPHGVLFRELKRDGAHATQQQQVWLDALTRAGADAAVWRPADLVGERVRAELQILRQLPGQETRHLHLPPPPPFNGDRPDQRCPVCRGRRIIGGRYRVAPAVPATRPGAPAAAARRLLVDEFCPRCLGCGRRSHAGCDRMEHADWEPDDELPADGCPWCHGRGWYGVPAYRDHGGGLHHLRMPCDCARAQLVEVP